MLAAHRTIGHHSRLPRTLSRSGLQRRVRAVLARVRDDVRSWFGRLNARRGRDIRRALPERFVAAAYEIVLRRRADRGGFENYVGLLRRNELPPEGVLDEMLTSMEFRRNVRPRNWHRSIHQSRCDFVQMMPRARRILDLGGTDLDAPAGALVSMGYPYDFETVTIVDLPHDDRHELYADSAVLDEVDSERGRVQYRYHSMADLSRYDDGAFDLVVSGQTIEHITEDEARGMLDDVFRVLAPGGWFCVDTPNRSATRLAVGDVYSNPDHKIEYDHEHLSAMLRAAGFEVTASYGLNYMGESMAKGRFDIVECAANRGVYADIENCYVLAYICRKPGATG